MILGRADGAADQAANQLQRELEFIREHRENLFRDLAGALNSTLQTNYSIRFWRIIVGPWVNNFVPFVLAELRPRATVPRQDIPREVPASFDDFSARTFLLRYAALVAQDACGSAGFEDVVASQHPLAKTRTVGWRRLLVAWAKRLHWLLQGVLPGAPRVVVRDGYFPPRCAWRIWRRSWGRIRFDRRDYDWCPDELRVDKALRMQLRAYLGKCDREPEATIRKLIPLHLPRCYLEGFHALERKADKVFNRDPVVYFTCNAHWHDEIFKLNAARSVDAGARFIVGQHGANYGVVQDLLAEEFEREVSDRFTTWGWSEDEHTVPLPAPKLVGVRERMGRPITDEIIFISTTTIANGALTDPYTAPLFDAYLAWQLRFIGALPQALRRRLRFRVLRDWGRGFWEPLVRRFPEVMFESAYQCNATFIERLAASRMFVCDYIGTSYAEALAANKPTVMFWDPQVMKVRQSAAPFMDALHAAAVLHYDPEAAAREVEKAYADVSGWWNEAQRVRAVSAFQRAFLRMSDDPSREWVDFLLHEAARAESACR